MEMLNKIICGDSYNLIKQIPDNSIDCIYTDIPYLFENGGGGNSEVCQKISKMRDEISFISSGIDYNIFSEFLRVLKKINIFIWCSRLQIYPILDWFAKNTNCSYNILTWNKTNPIPATNGSWLSDIEYCLYFNKGSKLNDGMELKSKWYTSPINQKSKKLFEHPTIKPLGLVERHLLHTTQPNDMVLDPFCGSGTTCVGAKNHGRRFIGIEIDEHYAKIAQDRINQQTASGQLTFFNI